MTHTPESDADTTAPFATRRERRVAAERKTRPTAADVRRSVESEIRVSNGALAPEGTRRAGRLASDRLRMQLASVSRSQQTTGARRSTFDPSARKRRAGSRPALVLGERRSVRDIVTAISTRSVAFAALGLVVVGAAAAIPAHALLSESGAATASTTTQKAQSLNVDGSVANANVTTAEFGTSTSVQQGMTGVNSPGAAIQWPVQTPSRISSGFGERSAPCADCTSFHEGIDIVAALRTPVFAAADGVVREVSDETTYGTHIIIDHNIPGSTQMVSTVYAHLTSGSPSVKVGDTVHVGEQIALSGNTGASTGPHLHFEVRLDDVKVDPYAWMVEHANKL